eukprot:gene29087-16716_t
MSGRGTKRRKKSAAATAAAAGGGGSATAGSASASPSPAAVIKARVMAQVCGRVPPSAPRGFDNEESQLESLLSASIGQGDICVLMYIPQLHYASLFRMVSAAAAPLQ